MRPSAWSLRTRLTVALTLAFTLAGGALLGGQYLASGHLLRQAVDVVSILVTTVEDDATLEVTDDATGQSATEQAAPRTTGEAAAPAPGSGLEEGEAICTEDLEVGAVTCTFADGSSIESVELPGDGETDLGAQIEFSQSALATSVLTSLSWWSLALLVVFAGVAAVLAWWISRRSLRRLELVTEAAGQVGHDDLDTRLHLTGPQDEVRALADAFDAMLDRLDDAFGAQRRFVANASHELRTPLTTARTALEIPLDQGRVPEDLLPAVRRSLAANERSSRLLDALLTLARAQHPEAGESTTERLDLAEVAESSARDLAGLAAEREVSVDLDLAPAPVDGDRVLLHQVCQNLVDNAVVHNRPGGRVSVRTVQRGAHVLLEVVNDGAPVDPQQVAALREPFHRGTATRLSDGRSAGAAERGRGLGLGLSVVDEVVRRCGGVLDLDAREEGGLRVRVRLPIVPAAEHPSTADQGPEAPGS